MPQHMEKSSMTPEEQSDRKSLLGFSFLHFINDMHSTALPTIIPMLVNSISITLSQAGLLNAVFGLTNLFGQPVAGYLADRQKRPWLAVWAPMLSIAGACLLPLSPNYAIAFLLVGLMSMGTASFHPQGLGRAGSSAGSNDLALFIALFAACGSFGSAVGPVYVVFLTSLIGKKMFPIVLIPGFIICMYIWKRIVSDQKAENITKEKAEFRGFFSNMRGIMQKITSIVVAATVRDATLQGIRIFLPMLVVLKGGSIAKGGMLLFGITMACTLAGIIGGRLADSRGDEKVMLWTMGLSPIFLITGLNTSGVLSVAALIVGFAFLQASTSVTTAMAQKKCPFSRSSASSLAMGVSWGLANLFTTPVGFSADIIGLEKTLQIVAFLPWTVTAWYTGKMILSKRVL
ncbi:MULTISPECIES: MFS transporter [Synergistaceae]|jgi:FSR family fosmidomycin resistance protein-like MFS transporter|uniref:MFS transporter n=1 Tax=Synergistaceae TaxID=649777 RepID=UPI003AEEA7C1|nr:MFS transporter [Synergistaceae bacterium DZ-S4]